MNYRTVSDFFFETFGERVRKIPVDAGLGCPCHCSYCNNDSFSPEYADKKRRSITEQIEEGIRFLKANKSLRKAPESYLVYFQSHTNTFGPVRHLIDMYEEALAYPGVRGLVIATRPDCLCEDLLDWFEIRFGQKKSRTNETGKITTPYLLVELGIESTNDSTLERIKRGHNFECARKAVIELNRRGIDTGAHIIIGLPGEDEADFFEHAHKLNQLPIKTLKLHQLQIIKGTPLAEEYMKESTDTGTETDPGTSIKLLSAEEYAGIVIKFIDILRPDIAIDRFVSEAPQNMVLAPRWGLKPSEFSHLLDSLQ